MRYLKRTTDLVYRHSTDTRQVPPLPEGFEIVRLERESIRQFFGVAEEDQPRARTYLRLLDQGCYGHMVHFGKQWAAVQWLATPDSAPPPHLPARVAEGKYWCFNEHTRKKYRRIGLWYNLKRHGIAYARNVSKGARCPVFSDTDVGNIGSRIAHERIGFEPDGVITRTKIIVPRIKTLNIGSWAEDAPHPRTP